MMPRFLVPLPVPWDSAMVTGAATMRTLLKLISLLALIFWASTAFARTTYHIAVKGKDNPNCTSKAHSCATFAYVRGLMHAGDTLIIGDGIYDQCINTPVSGSPGAYTTYKAEHDWAVTVSTRDSSCAGSVFENYNGRYIVIQGIKFQGQGVLIPVSVSGDHVKLIRIAAWDAPCANNISVIGIGADYTLLEDVHVWGCGRYMVNIYHSDHTVLRRVVARYDFNDCAPGNSWGGQESTFTAYDSDNTVFENVIAIDSGIRNDSLYTCDQLFGGIWWENHGDILYDGRLERTGTVLGSIFLNIHSMNNSTNVTTPNPVGVESRYKIAGNTTVHTEINNVYWDVESGGSYGIHGDGCAPSCGSPTLSIQHNLYGNVTGTHGGGNGYTLGVGIADACNDPTMPKAGYSCAGRFSSNTFQNSLVINNNNYGDNGEPGDYNDYWKNGRGGNAHYVNVSAGAHDTTLNPGLLYLPRIEASSSVHGTASDGGDRGANIIYKYGVDGTLWGETGWNTLTANPLWPYPFESVIKQDMALYRCVPNCTAGNFPPAVRGFVLPDSNTTAPGRLYGGPRTLTSYIWEYLGNACPSEICRYNQIKSGDANSSIGSAVHTDQPEFLFQIR
ncbi:MAG: hypothetical protein WBE13_05810 [Candidatus Acidiferrum sp.]